MANLGAPPASHTCATGTPWPQTTDAGAHWNATRVHGIFMGLGAADDLVVTAGMFSLQESLDGGKTFHSPKQVGALMGLSQYVVSGPGMVAVVGQDAFGTWNGFSVANASGTLYATNISELTSPARFGDMPSATTWYASAGIWPTDLVDNALRSGSLAGQRISRNWAVVQDASTGLRGAAAGAGATLLPLWQNRDASDLLDSDNGLIAEIAKTTDAGKTWTRVYHDPTHSFYLNQISCWDEQTCCAAGESGGGHDPAARIVCTYDGGVTWQETLKLPGIAESLIAIRFKSATEVWAGGATLGDDVLGRFVYSLDAGKTWNMGQTMIGQYPNDFCGAGGKIYASTFNSFNSSSFLALEK